MARALLDIRRMTHATPRTVEDIMTRDVVTIDENDDLWNLREILRSLRYRHLPVTDQGRLVGLLTERDVLGISASTLLPHGHDTDRLLHQRFRVRDVMQREVLTVSATALIGEAGRIMLDKRISCLPVVDASNNLLGIVTSSDLIRVAVTLVPSI